MLQAAMIGIAGVLLALQIKAVKPEFSVYLSIATSVFLLFLVAGKLEVVVESVKLIQSSISIQSSYIQALLKIIGITYIAEFASDICRDAGYGAIAGQIGVFSKLSILAVSMPIITALLETIREFLGT